MNIFKVNYPTRLTVILLLVVQLFAVVTSCKKGSPSPIPDQVVANDFDTPEKIERKLIEVYGTVKAGAFLGGRYQIYNDIRAEEFISRNTTAATGYKVYNGTFTGSDVYISEMWEQGYKAVTQANSFLEGLAKNPATISPGLAGNYRGEVKFIRALSYLSLVQAFAKPFVTDAGASPGLPLKLSADAGTPNSSSAKSTVAEICNQITKDLNEAEAELPDTYNTPFLRTTRIHKNSAIALKPG